MVAKVGIFSETAKTFVHILALFSTFMHMPAEGLVRVLEERISVAGCCWPVGRP